MSDQRHFFEKHKNELGQIGEIISVFNRIENVVIHFVTGVFVSIYDGQERSILVNDTLNDITIFETFNQKLNFLEKIISRVAMIATKQGSVFAESKYLAVCKKIRSIQKYRNKIAHMPFSLSSGGKAVIFKRKKDKELLVTTSGSLTREDLDLKEVKEKIWTVYNEAERVLLKEGLTRAMNILLKEELANFDRTRTE